MTRTELKKLIAALAEPKAGSPFLFSFQEDVDYSDDPDEEWFTWKVETRSGLVYKRIQPVMTGGMLLVNRVTCDVSVFSRLKALVAFSKGSCIAADVRNILVALVTNKPFSPKVARDTKNWKLERLVNSACVPCKDGLHVTAGSNPNQVSVTYRQKTFQINVELTDDDLVILTSPQFPTFKQNRNVAEASLRQLLKNAHDNLSRRPSSTDDTSESEGSGAPEDDDDYDDGEERAPKAKRPGKAMPASLPMDLEVDADDLKIVLAGSQETLSDKQLSVYLEEKARPRFGQISPFEKRFALALLFANVHVPTSLRIHLKRHNFSASKNAIALVDAFESACFDGREEDSDAARLSLMRFISDVEDAA